MTLWRTVRSKQASVTYCMLIYIDMTRCTLPILPSRRPFSRGAARSNPIRAVRWRRRGAEERCDPDPGGLDAHPRYVRFAFRDVYRISRLYVFLPPTDNRNLPALGRIGDPDDIIASVRVENGEVSLLAAGDIISGAHVCAFRSWQRRTNLCPHIDCALRTACSS